MKRRALDFGTSSSRLARRDEAAGRALLAGLPAGSRHPESEGGLEAQRTKPAAHDPLTHKEPTPEEPVGRLV